MDTKALIGIIVAIVVVGGGAWYFSSQNPAEGEPNDNGNTSQSSGEGTFKDLMSAGGSHTCTVETFIEEAPSVGTVFIADSKIRADFVSKPADLGGKEVTSHMIHVDGYVYTWSDMMPQGMKMKAPAGDASAEAATSGPLDSDTRVKYSCESWMKDDSKFVPPSTVTFMELGANGMPTMPIPN